MVGIGRLTLSIHRRLRTMKFRSFSFMWLLVTAFPLLADSPAEQEKQSDKKADPETVAKASPPIKLDGIFQAVRQSELMIDNEQLTEFKLLRILPHGTTVKAGAPVIWFDTDGLDEKLEKAETEYRLAELQMEADEFAYEQFLESQELDRDAAKRARDDARSDYDHFIKTQLEREIADAKQDLKSAEFSVESAKEELDQLTQMYEEDDLTEESEEIVLRRAQFTYESAMHRLTGSKIRIQRALDVLIPRREASQEEALDRALMRYDKAMHELDIAKRKRELEMERKREDVEETLRDFEQMREERKDVVLKAPHEGIVLHGKLNRGKLSDKPVSWSPGSKLANRTVIATIVDPAKLQVRVDIPEQHRALIQPGKPVVLTAKAMPDVSFTAKVREVADVPYVPGKFDCVISVPMKKVSGVRPTMACEVEIERQVQDDE